MCNLLSVVVSIAAAGLTAGGGLDLGGAGLGFEGIDLGSFADMSDVVSEMGSVVTDVVDQAIDVCSDFVGDVLTDLPSGLTGQMDLSIFSDFALENLDFASTNLFESISQQGASLISGGIPGVTEIIGGAKAFCEQATQTLASIQNAATFTVGGQSFNALTIFDQCTGGAVSKVLNPVQSVVGLATGVVGAAEAGIKTVDNIVNSTQELLNDAEAKFKSFAGDLTNFGSGYDFGNLNEAFTYPDIARNLSAQGLTQLDPALQKLGVTAAQAFLSNPTDLKAAFSTVTGGALDIVKQQTGFNAAITSLDQMLMPAAVLTASTLALVQDFNGIKDRITSIGPTTVNSFAALGQTLQQMEFPKSSDLIGLENDVTKFKATLESGAAARASLVGSGTGVFGNPTMDDVIGTMTGKTYTPKLLEILKRQKKIMSSSTGQALRGSIQSAIDNARAGKDTGRQDADAIRAAAQDILNPSTNEMREDIEVMNRLFAELQDQLVREKRNLKAARILPNQVQGSLSHILAFLDSLSTAYKDDLQIGYRQFIEDLVSDDIYGEAILAAIVEGKNKDILQRIGVTYPAPTLVQYTDEVSSARAAMFARCCPEEEISYGFKDSLLVVYEGDTIDIVVDAPTLPDGSLLPYTVSIR